MKNFSIKQSTAMFTKLFTQGAETLRSGTEDPPRFVSHSLRVVRGKHVGATQNLDADEHIIGDSLDCDLVLLDLEGKRIRLEKVGDRYRLFARPTISVTAAREHGELDVSTDPTNESTAIQWSLIPPSETYARTLTSVNDDGSSEAFDDATKKKYEVCDVYVFGSVAFEVVANSTRPNNGPLPSTASRAQSVATKSILAAGFFAVTGIVYAISLAFTNENGESTAARGNVALAQSSFGNVHIRKSLDGGSEFAGVVSDDKELNQLKQWARANGLTHLPVRVFRLDKFRDKLSESLSGSDVKVQITSTGALRVDGNVKSPAISARLNTIIKEIGSAAIVENKLVVTPDPPPIAPVLPFRIAVFRPGSPGYIELEGGFRYFEGSTTPEGYEVVSVSSSSVRFTRAGKESVVSLN